MDVRIAKTPTSAAATWSPVRRTAVILSAVIGCVLNSGVVFGYSAIYPVFIQSDVFHDVCPDHGQHDTACAGQRLALSGMFTIATTALYVSSFPLGVLLDRFGPRLATVVATLLLAIGCNIFSRGGPGSVGHAAYCLGFFLVAVSGPVLFNSAASFGNLFPKRRGMVMATLVGSFDCSSSVFLGMALVVDEYSMALSEVFTGYSLVPLATCVVALVLWPARPVVPTIGGGYIPLSPLEVVPVQQQVTSPEFGLLVGTMAVNIVAINFFISSVYPQVLAVQPVSAGHLTKVFSALLPAGSIASMPISGFVIDYCGPTVGFFTLWGTYASFAVCLAMYRFTSCQYFAYAAFSFFAFSKPHFYTLAANYTGQTFGFSTFGRVYGLAVTVAGFANSLVLPLTLLAESHGFFISNMVVLTLHLGTLALPVAQRFLNPPLPQKAKCEVARASGGA